MSKKQAPMLQQTEPEDSVKLKPLFGIRPGVYLTVLYSIVLLIILFFIFVYHGLVNYGTVLEVKTEPMGAAIRVNGVYMGTSGTKIPLPNFIKPMENINIEAVLPGFQPQGGIYQIPGRVFGTRFFPRRYRLEFTLHTADPAGTFAQAIAEYASWSFGGEPTEAWQIPLVLSEGAYRIGQTVNSEQLTVNSEILKAASRFAVTRPALRDLLRAKALLDNGGISPSPAALADSISDILVFLSENPGSAQWLVSMLPPQSGAIIRESAWYKNTQIPGIREIYSGQVVSGRRMEIAGLAFIEITAQSAQSAQSAQPAFMISENPVSRSLFETFLKENPQWADHFTDYFEGEISHPAEIYGKNTITGVTWYGAQAFCQWLTQRLPSSMAGMEARLPKEDEWALAAQSGIRSMNSPGWEWCADPFAPLSFIKASPKAIEAAGSPERSLRGQSSASSAPERTSLPPEFSSPVVTFRPVIAQRIGE